MRTSSILENRRIKLASPRSPAPGADDQSYISDITSDGRWVVFSSDASNLAPKDGDVYEKVFIRGSYEPTTPRAARVAACSGGHSDSSVGATGCGSGCCAPFEPPVSVIAPRSKISPWSDGTSISCTLSASRWM
jgi:hypothetical protein